MLSTKGRKYSAEKEDSYRGARFLVQSGAADTDQWRPCCKLSVSLNNLFGCPENMASHLHGVSCMQGAAVLNATSV